jgi:hypothetical protein
MPINAISYPKVIANFEAESEIIGLHHNDLKNPIGLFFSFEDEKESCYF